MIRQRVGTLGTLGFVVAVHVQMCALCAPRTLGAQQGPGAPSPLRGVVRDGTFSQPIAGAVVSVLDAAGATLARTITDANGHFTVAIPDRATRLHLIRIGYHPADAAVPPAERRDMRLELRMARLPALLSAVKIFDQELCPGSTDRGAAFELWEQARAGLLAAIVAREASPAETQTLVYRRTTRPDDDRVITQASVGHANKTSRPFLSPATAAIFAQRGYMVEDRTGRTFDAPDADVLLDESFAATHCFHFQRSDGAHRGQFGLAFTPVPSRPRDTLVDVTGTIWIDRDPPEIRTLDFLYTGLEPTTSDVKAGGHIEFRTMANGITFVQRWFLRLPVLSPIAGGGPAYAAALARRRQDRGRMRVGEVIEKGGVVVDASWQDGVVWREPPTGINGVVTQGRSNIGLPNAIVTLVGTNDSTMTDPQGRFTLMPIIPGHYTLVAIDTVLHEYVRERSHGKDLEIARGQFPDVQLQLKPEADVMADACHGQDAPKGTSVITGALAMHNGVAPKDVRVSAEWRTDDTASAHQDSRAVDADANGRFIICGMERDRSVHVSLRRKSGGASVADTTISVDDRERVPLEWRVMPATKDAQKKQLKERDQRMLGG